MHRPGIAFAALGWLAAMATEAPAQVAFQPVVSAFPNGVSLQATPVVSADRRYVRMTLNPQFNALEGFDTVPVPAAVGGGFGGGFRNVGVPGTTFAAGMDGPIDPESYGNGSFPGHLPPSASPMASALLGGDAGYPDRPRLAPTPSAHAPRQAARRPTRIARSKKTRPGSSPPKARP